MAQSAYGHIKEAEVIACLPPAEQEELEKLKDRHQYTHGQVIRLDELWARAFAIHEERQRVRQAEIRKRREEIVQLEREIRELSQ